MIHSVNSSICVNLYFPPTFSLYLLGITSIPVYFKTQNYAETGRNWNRLKNQMFL
jgi:hypothetical protein